MLQISEDDIYCVKNCIRKLKWTTKLYENLMNQYLGRKEEKQMIEEIKRLNKVL